MAKNDSWLNWLKCNALELVILVLVLVLLVKVYSAPAIENVLPPAEVTVKEPLAEEAAPEVIAEGAITEETSVEKIPVIKE